MIFVDYPGHFVAILLLGTAALLVFLAFHCSELRKKEFRTIRLLLVGLKYLAILILLIILWNPSRSKEIDTYSKNSVLALFDTSKSMSIIEDSKTTRLDKALEIFDDNFQFSRRDIPEFSILGFDTQVYHSGSTQLLRRWGQKTNMQSVFNTLRKYDDSGSQNTDRKISTNDEEESLQVSKYKGAVIFTDGQVDDQSVLTYLPLARKDFPIVIIGIGSREQKPDVAIKSINAPVRASIDSVYKIETIVSANNLEDEPVIIELLRDDQVINSKQIPAKDFTNLNQQDKNNVPVEFTVTADSLGSHNYMVRACTLKHEVNPENNARYAVTEVVENDEIKVLFYTQAANFNVGKVRQVLSLDSRIQLDLGFDAIKTIGLSVAATKKLGYIRLPANQEEFKKYDIIILGDCLLDSMTNEQISGLYDFVVKRGGGLIFLPGRGEYGPADWKNPVIKPLMPVVFDKENPKLWPPNPNQIELTLEGENGGIIDFTNVPEYDAQVSAFYKIASVKPAASTLATSKGLPLISLHRIGRGKVCLLNISQLFLLYREDLQGGLLYKIISGLISYLSSSAGPSSGIELFVERSGDQEDKIKYSAYVCDSSFSPVEQGNVLLNIKNNVLTMNPTGKGYYVAEVDESQSDTIIATVQAEIGGVFLGEKSIAVNLPPRKNEMTNTEFNEHFLQALAEQTNALYLHEDKIDRDIVKIFDAQTYMGQSKRITSIWPRWPLLITLCLILFLEWFLRRAKGLV